MEIRRSVALTSELRTVCPPTAMPDVDSTTIVIVEVPQIVPVQVAIADVIPAIISVQILEPLSEILKNLFTMLFLELFFLKRILKFLYRYYSVKLCQHRHEILM